MSNKSWYTSKSAIFVMLFALIGTSGCGSKSPALESLRAENLTWTQYTSEELNFSIDYPTILKPEGSEKGEVIFRYGWGAPVVVRFVDEAEGKDRGVWFGNTPAAKIKLASHDGEKFVYDHYDGPFSARTVSYVVTYRGKFLGLEFRTGGDLNEIQKRMLDSFTFTSN